jgi:hypothetical protein
MAALIGHFTVHMVEEMEKPQPDAARIAAYDTFVSELRDEQRSLGFDRPDLVHKALFVYSTLVKAIYAAAD